MKFSDPQVVTLLTGGCPTEWLIEDDGHRYAVHYRFGQLTVHTPDWAQTLWEAQVGDPYDGHMEDDDMLTHLRGATP